MKIGGRHINNLRYEDGIMLLPKSSHDLKHMMKVKEESGKARLHWKFKETRIMTTDPILT